MTALTEVGEEGLRKMLEVCTDFTERRQIRAALRELQFGCIPGLLAGHHNNSNNHTTVHSKMSRMGYQANSLKSSKNMELDKKLQEMTTEEEMTKLLHGTSDFNDRMQIRAAIREIKKKKQVEDDSAKVAARKSKTSRGGPMSRKIDLNLTGEEDEATLRHLLEETHDSDQQKQIREAIKHLRQKARETAVEVINKEEEEYRKQHPHPHPQLHAPDEESIPAVSVEDVEFPKDSQGVVDFTLIDDIPALEKMLANTDDFGERTQIREHLKELHERQDLEVPDYPQARRLSEGLEADIFWNEQERRRSSVVDRAALEELTLTTDEIENVSYDEIEDPEELEKLLETATDIGEKRMIRGALKALRKKLADSPPNRIELRLSIVEELLKKTTGPEAKTPVKFEYRSRKTDSSSRNKPQTHRIAGSFERPKTPNSNGASEGSEPDEAPVKRREAFLRGGVETDNKENKRTPCLTATSSWESGRAKRDGVKSSSPAMLPPKERNNNDISIKPSRIPTTTNADFGRSRHDASKISTPSRFDTTQKENEKNKRDAALSAKMKWLTTPTSENEESRRRDRFGARTPSSPKLERKGMEARDTGLKSRISKFSTPQPDSSRGTFSSTPGSSGSKLDSLKSKFSGSDTLRHTENRIQDRVLKGTHGKVSEAASKFGGSCSGSSCSTTPSQSPMSSAPSSPRRVLTKSTTVGSPTMQRAFGSPTSKRALGSPTTTKALGSPTTPRAFETGRFHKLSTTTPSPGSLQKSDVSSTRTKFGDKSSIPVPSSTVPSSSKLQTSRFETSVSRTTTPSAFGAKKDVKSSRFEVPLGREFSLELQTSGDRTVKVEPSYSLRSSYASPSLPAETKSRDRFGSRSSTERANPARRRSLTDRKEVGKTVTNSDKMPPVDDIDDEETLEKMLEAASDFEERKKIRAKLREIRKKRREEQERKVAEQQKAIQDDIQRSREETKARRLTAFDKSTPVKKDTTSKPETKTFDTKTPDTKTTDSKTPLNNNTIIAPLSSSTSSSSSPAVQTKSTTIEDLDGKSKTMTTESVIEGPGSKTVISTTLSKSEDKDTKSQSMKQDVVSVKKEESSSGSSFSAKSSSMSSSVTTSSSSSTGGTPAKKMTKFEQEMEEKKRQREQKRLEDEKNWKEYMAKKKQDEQQKRNQSMQAAQKKKDALMNKFGGKADAESGGFGKGTGMAAVPNASTIKQKLLEWCQRCARGYPEVEIRNFSSSWADGMAFCAIVHYHFPNAFDFDSLEKKNRRKNFDLAFNSAEKHADIMPLLETDDMIMMKNKPDWKCVFTYVQSLYRHLSKLKQ